MAEKVIEFDGRRVRLQKDRDGKVYLVEQEDIFVSMLEQRHVSADRFDTVAVYSAGGDQVKHSDCDAALIEDGDSISQNRMQDIADDDDIRLSWVAYKPEDDQMQVGVYDAR